MKKEEQKSRSLPLCIVGVVVCGLLLTLAVALLSLSLWYHATFSISFEDLLFTLLSPLGGTGVSTVSQIVEAILPQTLGVLLIYIGLVIVLWNRYRRSKLLRRILALICAVALIASAVFAVFVFRIPEYLVSRGESTDLYEKDYVDPDTVNISANGKTNNLIYIYLESMETTYLDEANGGSQAEINYLPHLTQLARENVTFSDDGDADKLGGFHSIAGTAWTMGALMGTTSGVPFSLSVFGANSHNSLGKNGRFVNGLTTLGDVLAEKGYTQEFLCGSDAAFAGRDTYFTVHGNYEIFDYNTAIEKGYIDSDYKVWWGYEDAILFEIAKDEATRLAQGDQPFNLTMLTVDAHHVGGYQCSQCGQDYDTKLENVLACQDNLVSAFVAWCMEQPFYENTTIIITGDHPRMDTQLVGDADENDRTVYNCFINALAEPFYVTGRTFTSLDMFPTILSAMGFTIEGERLGLGTNLFSVVPTLAEKYGYEWLDTELSKYSAYYKENFT